MRLFVVSILAFAFLSGCISLTPITTKPPKEEKVRFHKERV